MSPIWQVIAVALLCATLSHAARVEVCSGLTTNVSCKAEYAAHNCSWCMRSDGWPTTNGTCYDAGTTKCCDYNYEGGEDPLPPVCALSGECCYAYGQNICCEEDCCPTYFGAPQCYSKKKGQS